MNILNFDNEAYSFLYDIPTEGAYACDAIELDIEDYSSIPLDNIKYQI